jgi:fumarylpyruvate hydrolase
MNSEFPLWSPPCIPIANSDKTFPVRRIYTIGRNYADHAAETGLGGASGSAPGISLKPADSILLDGGVLTYPPSTRQLDPEVEMVVAIGRDGQNISREDALDYVFGYAVGFDVIRRDVMHDCIANEHSWDLCKSFTGASPVSAVRPAAEIGHPKTGEIILEVDGEIRQQGDISQLIWKTADIVSRLSHYDRICVGDIIFTGTPKGPKPVVPGNQLIGRIDSIAMLNITINQ